MKRVFLSAFLVASTICGMFFSSTLDFGRAENSLDRVPTFIAESLEPYTTTPVHDVIVRLPNGTLCASFSSNRLGARNAIYVSSSNDDGATWGTPTKVSNAPGTTIIGNGTTPPVELNLVTRDPVIAADANNNVYVAWGGATEDSLQVWSAIYNGSAWSTSTQVSRGLEPRLYAGFLSIAVDGNNKVHLVWDSSINGNSTYDYEHSRIFYAKYDGAWSAPTVISNWPDPTHSFHFNPRIVVDSKNNLYVVWAGNDYPATRGEIWYTRYNGTWQAPVKITTSTIPDKYANYLQAPSMAVDSNNNLHLVWQGSYDSSLRINQIWYMNYKTSWGTPIRISNVQLMNSSDQESPSIAVDSENRVHVVWMSTRERVLFYTRYNSSWSIPIQIEGYSSTSPHFRWSNFPASNRVTSILDYIFFRGSTLMFNSASASELPSGPSFSVSITPLSESISVGQSLIFTSTIVAGLSPYNYQWCLNGTAVSGATSASWTFKPTTSGTYNIYVIAKDSANNSAQSETAHVSAGLQQMKGSFGYTKESSEGGGGSSDKCAVVGSRFMLNVEANITSMSSLMSVMSDPNHPASYGYRFSIYKDNNGSVGSLVAQTTQGTLSNPFAQWSTLVFPSPVHLAPGAYWLMLVHNGSYFAYINQVITSDYNVSANAFIDTLNFPASLSPQMELGRLYCIYASWEVNYSGTVSTEKNILSVTSNSTVTALAYNSATNELSFTVSGPSNTTGYAEIFISKTLLENTSKLTVTMDENPLNFTYSSLDDFWVLHFVYSHSSHNIAIKMQPDVIPEFAVQFAPVFLTVTFAFLLCVLFLHKRHKTKT